MDLMVCIGEIFSGCLFGDLSHFCDLLPSIVVDGLDFVNQYLNILNPFATIDSLFFHTPYMCFPF